MGKYVPKLPFGTIAVNVVVDYGKTVATMRQDSGLDFYDPLGRQFPVLFSTFGNGKVAKLLYLVPFFKTPHRTTEATALVQKLGLQQGKAEDLLALLRDRREYLVTRGVGAVVEYGTRWWFDDSSSEDPSFSKKMSYSFFERDYFGYEKKSGSYNDFSMKKYTTEYNLWAKFLGDRQLRFGYPGDPWNVEKTYILAVAEDNVRRKIHKMPRPDCPYPQPKPYTPPAGGSIRAASVGIIGALEVKVHIDYTQTAKQMANAAGYSGMDYGCDLEKIPVDKGKPANPSKGLVKRTLILVPTAALTKTGYTIPAILKLLDEYHLEPAFPEDLFALIRDYRKDAQIAKKTSFAAWGADVRLWVLPNDSKVHVDSGTGKWSNECWAVVTLKKKA